MLINRSFTYLNVLLMSLLASFSKRGGVSTYSKVLLDVYLLQLFQVYIYIYIYIYI